MDVPAIHIRETAGLKRDPEVVTFGLPLPKSRCFDPAALCLRDESGQELAADFTPLAWWSDSSLRWVLCHVRISLKAWESRGLSLAEPGAGPGADGPSGIVCNQSRSSFAIHCGQSAFEISAQACLPFSRISWKGHDLLQASEPGLVLVDDQDRQWSSGAGSWRVESASSLCLSLVCTGRFAREGRAHPLRYACRLGFQAGQDRVRLEVTLHNPGAAQHPGNCWDLGDAGSVCFKDLSLRFALGRGRRLRLYLQAEPGLDVLSTEQGLSLYQDSSGGRNWRSKNHVNRRGEVPVRFQGYACRREGTLVSQGKRAQPLLAVDDTAGALGMCLPCFWQNFPKALEADGEGLRLRLFPEEFQDVFELQGGEQKTHVLYLAAGGRAEEVFSRLDRARRPLEVSVHPDWMRRSRAFPGFVPATGGSRPGEAGYGAAGAASAAARAAWASYDALLAAAVQGDNSFFDRRELIDEYGWRHYGDLYADHEAVFHEGSEEFVSHYNNQYDVIKGALLQFWRTGEPAWFRLAAELADHVADIDIYHTDADRYQYNHGLFWHTDHHLDAASSSHRSISAAHAEHKQAVGGGPAPDHNYASGLVLLYWMTGSVRYREAALELAANISALMDGPDTLAEAGYLLLKKGLARMQAARGGGAPAHAQVLGLLEGPGRASGNALNTLLDACLVTGEHQYLDLAEQLIRCCVSPEDDVQGMDLLNAELRWMYTVFLKALGRYVELKESDGQQDDLHAFAQASFVHYALWMLENEYPYLDKPEILEFPNETWAAQELRKSDILALAGRMVQGGIRDRFMERSVFFFQTGLEQLQRFDNRALTRPLALVMTNGQEHMDVYAGWLQGRLPQGRDPGEIARAWRERRYEAGRSRGVRRLLRLLSRTSPAKEWRWIRDRLGRR